MTLDLVFHNAGRRPLRVEHSATRTSRLIGGDGRREPLVADEGCGYARHGPGAPIRPGGCQRNVDASVIPPGGTRSRMVSLQWDLPGAGRLAAGEYTYVRRVRHRIGRRRLPDLPVGLTFTIARAPRSVAHRSSTRVMRVTRRVAAAGPSRTARRVVELLARGPSAAERRAGIEPHAAWRRVRSVRLDGGRLMVDVARSPPSLGGSTAVALFVQSARRTLLSLDGVREIELRLDGSCTAFARNAQGETSDYCPRLR